jgi:hypothetical protein
MALLRVETFPGPVWEPACGEGHITVILKDGGYETVSSDLVDRDFGDFTRDFFDQSVSPKVQGTCCCSIITNPPFRVKRSNGVYYVEQWVEHAFRIVEIQKAAFLMKTTALAGIKRSKIFEENGFKGIYQFRGRIPFSSGNIEESTSGMMDFAWFVFERDYPFLPFVKWIEMAEDDGLSYPPKHGRSEMLKYNQLSFLGRDSG